MSERAVVLDPLFDEAGAAAMVALCERVGGYRMYADREKVDTDIGRGLSQRQDAVSNHLRTGGRTGADESLGTLARRTSYFREEFAYGGYRVDGIEPFLGHPALFDAAVAIHGRPVIEPAIVYGNLMVPGQEHAVHTDVPEFRGANRKIVPQWLIVAMLHSGLFDEYRMPIATGIAWFHDCDGGELSYWPDGPDAPVALHPVRYNTAMVLDTDRTFHGVDRVADVPADSVPRIGFGTRLECVAPREWVLRNPDGSEIGRYDWSELRLSVSWKAYCFRDEHERDTWRDHADDLTLDRIVDRFVDDLAARGRVAPDVARDAELGQCIIDEYIRFPASTSSSTG